MPNFKNLSPSARFNLYVAYSSPAMTNTCYAYLIMHEILTPGFEFTLTPLSYSIAGRYQIYISYWIWN